jgi:hypothetical protein
MKRIAMALAAGTLSLSALAFGAKQANAAELPFKVQKIDYEQHREFRGERSPEQKHERNNERNDQFRKSRFHGRGAQRELRMRRFHKGC